jgi:hypothetical protein
VQVAHVFSRLLIALAAFFFMYDTARLLSGNWDGWRIAYNFGIDAFWAVGGLALGVAASTATWRKS